MSTELSSIATKALEKKQGKTAGLSALMKAGIDPKDFEEKLKNETGKVSKDKQLKPVLLNIKQETKSSQNSADTNGHVMSSEHRELLIRQAMSFGKMKSELSTEKLVSELRSAPKDDKKLASLLEKMDKSGIKGEVKIEKINDESELGETKKSKKNITTKKEERSEQTNLTPKDIESKSSGDKKQNIDALKTKVPQDKEVEAKPNIVDNKSTEKKEVKPEPEQKKLKENDKEVKLQKSALDETENAKVSTKKEVKAEAEATLEPKEKEVQSLKKEVKVENEPKKEVVEVKNTKDDKKQVDDKKETLEPKKEVVEIASQKIVQTAQKDGEKTVQPVKKQDEKPQNLQDLLLGVEDIKVKRDESDNKRHEGEAKKDSSNEEKWLTSSKLGSIMTDQTKIEDTIAQKIKDVPAVLKNFADDLQDKIDEYRPPIMKVTMELRPENMAPVDVTMITRGQNLIINLNSSDEALKMFMSNASDFRQNLMNIGFTEMTMNFNFKDQNGEKRQYQYQEQSGKKYKEIADSSIVMSDIEVVIPRYA